MDDERDIEEERAQEAATREEQEAELAGDSAPVDSSSDEHKASGDDPTEEPAMLWEGMETAPLIDQLHQILRLCNFAERQAVQIKDLYRRGIDPDSGRITLELSVLESQALSTGLNLVGLFAPELAADAASLLKRAVDLTNSYRPSEEELKLLYQIANDIQLEATAKMLGLTVEEYRDFLIQAAEAETAEETQSGDPSLN